MKNLMIFTIILLTSTFSEAQHLKIIDQDYEEALSIAAKEGKLIFVDFYTTWCGPCKKLDKLIFQNDSIQKVLGADFVLLKYDAERDTVHHLSKKHHIRSYPTGLILNKSGYVLNRKYGFPGEDFSSLLQSVMAFAGEGVELNGRNEILKGYSNKVDVSAYPSFYIDYVNRENTKPDSLEFASYWIQEHDVFSEGYFTTLLYFSGMEMPENTTDDFLENKARYEELYGETNVSIALLFMSFGRLDVAVSSKSRTVFDGAKDWVKSALGEELAGKVMSNYEAEFNKLEED